MEFKHEPVLLNEVLEWMNVQPDGVYCDGTLGGGGHSGAILKASGGTARLYGIDRDENAILAANLNTASAAVAKQFVINSHLNRIALWVKHLYNVLGGCLLGDNTLDEVRVNIRKRGKYCTHTAVTNTMLIYIGRGRITIVKWVKVD